MSSNIFKLPMEMYTFTKLYSRRVVNPINLGSTVTDGVVGSLPAYGKVTTTAGGVANNLAGN